MLWHNKNSKALNSEYVSFVKTKTMEENDVSICRLDVDVRKVAQNFGGSKLCFCFNFSEFLYFLNKTSRIRWELNPCPQNR